MSGLGRPSQMAFDPTPAAVQPLQQMLVQAMMGQMQQPPGNRNPMAGQMPPMSNIFQQLYGDQGGAPMMPPAMPPGGFPMNDVSPQVPQVASGSRMMHSAPGGNMPTLSQLDMARMMARRR